MREKLFKVIQRLEEEKFDDVELIESLRRIAEDAKPLEVVILLEAFKQ